MILRNKIIIITLITIVALVGVGFATFTFTTEKTSDVEDVSGRVMAAIEANGIQVKTADGSATVSNLYIICASQASNGIYWATDEEGEHPITEVLLIGSVNEQDFDYLDFATYTGTFTSSMTGAPNSTSWINLPTFNLSQDVTSSDVNDDVEYPYVLPTLSYKVVPSSVADVSDLYDEVSDLNLTITFSFKVKSVA